MSPAVSTVITNSDIIIRLLIALALCGLIGMERKHYRKPAGFRTNILVGLGSAILAIMAVQIFSDFNPGQAVDVGRIIGQVVTGIGFLGAGAIIQSRGSVHGLTTAATLWVVSAIGMAVGLGYFFLASMATIGALIVLEIFGRIEFKITGQQHIDELEGEQNTDQKK
jgi:putative Mg2+ transporter-C (MgtC) family protein